MPVTEQPPGGPAFDVPLHYGASRALEVLTSVAAPLLAAGGFTLVGAIAQSPANFGLGSAAILVLALAVFLLVMSVQFGFLARQHATTPREIADWWPTMPPEQRWHRVRREQWKAQAAYRLWGNRARVAYGLGVTFLWIGLSIALVPPDKVDGLRAVAIGTAAIAALVEICWALIAVVGRPGQRLRRFRVVGPVLSALGRQSPASPPPERWAWTEAKDPFQ
jgi:hypothetical protein